MSKQRCMISNQSNRSIIVKGVSIPPYGIVNDVSENTIVALREVYGNDTILVIQGDNPKPQPKGIKLPEVQLPPPATEGLLIKEESVIAAMKKFYVTGRFVGMTQTDVAAIVMSMGDRVVADVSEATHILVGDKPAKSVTEYADENLVPMLKLSDIDPTYKD